MEEIAEHEPEPSRDFFISMAADDYFPGRRVVFVDHADVILGKSEALFTKRIEVFFSPVELAMYASEVSRRCLSHGAGAISNRDAEPRLLVADVAGEAFGFVENEKVAVSSGPSLFGDSE